MDVTQLRQLIKEEIRKSLRLDNGWAVNRVERIDDLYVYTRGFLGSPKIPINFVEIIKGNQLMVGNYIRVNYIGPNNYKAQTFNQSELND